MKNFVTSEDYKGHNIEKSWASEPIIAPRKEPLSIEQIEIIVNENFSKGLIDEDTFNKALDELDLLKGGKTPVNKEEQKEANGGVEGDDNNEDEEYEDTEEEAEEDEVKKGGDEESDEDSEEEEEEVEKGGEGSRGGKVIGHTKSGKPIYANKKATHKVYSSFTPEEHNEAAEAHSKVTSFNKQGFQTLTSHGAWEKSQELKKEHEKMGESK